ncbi:MAG: acyl carrier protein [Clostridiales bacterium]|jgi:acyl carrier protein|nr:acyl carrier protein [Clostridiales bacterium]
MVFERVQKIICNQFDIVEKNMITLDTTIEELDADSMDLIDLAMSLEDEFEIEVPDEALAEIKSVRDIVKYIDEN